MTSLARLRRLWRHVHLWLGVGLLVVLVPISVTGAILVWHDPLDRALYAQRYAVTGPTASQPINVYARAADRAFAGRARLTEIRLPQTAGDPVVAVGRLAGEPGPGGRPRTLNVWIDPPTARVLDTAEVAMGFSMVLHRVHGTLLIPEVGRKVVGWLGWAMFVSCGTGLWLWWPRSGGVLRGLGWRRGPSTVLNLHHAVGFWICVPLAVLSLTGVYISFPQTSRALFGLPQPPPRAPDAVRFAAPLEAARLSIFEAVELARSKAPPAMLAQVRVPATGKAPAWRVELKTTASGDPTTITVVDATGKTSVEARKPGTGGGSDPVSKLVRRIHDGTDMGPLWQTIIVLGGLAPAVLSVTGVIMWLRRRSARA